MPTSLLLGPDARRAILARTFSDPAREIHLRELVRQTGFAPRTVQVEVDRLVAAGLLSERRDGNRRYLCANEGHPLFDAVRDIVRMAEGAAAETGRGGARPTAPAEGPGGMIDAQRDRIAALCRRYHVRRLDLVGSAARDDFDPTRSDVDLMVEFADDPARPALDAYFGFKEDLEALFGRHVDLIVAAAVINPYVRADLDRTRRVLYAA